MKSYTRETYVFESFDNFYANTSFAKSTSESVEVKWEREDDSEVICTRQDYLYALWILVIFGVENGMKYVVQGVFL